MNRHRFSHDIDPTLIPQPVVNLLEVIHTKLSDADRVVLAPLMDQVVDDACRRRRILSLVQQSISELRLDIRYLQFDLEATVRERDAAEAKLL